MSDAIPNLRPEPLRRVPRAARAYQGLNAGIVTRSLAGVTDGLVVVSALVALWFGWGAVRFLSRPVSFAVPSPSWALVLAVGSGLTLVYLTASWATTGRTYGDRLLGLRVVNARGGRMRWGGAALRAGLSIAFPAGLLWTVVSETNRSVQDLLLRTRVVYDWGHAQHQRSRTPAG